MSDVVEWSPEPGVILTSGEIPGIDRTNTSPVVEQPPPTKADLLAKLVEIRAMIEALSEE